MKLLAMIRSPSYLSGDISPVLRAGSDSDTQKRCEVSWNQDYKPDPETGVAILIVALFLAIFLSGIGVGVWLS